MFGRGSKETLVDPIDTLTNPDIDKYTWVEENSWKIENGSLVKRYNDVSPHMLGALEKSRVFDFFAGDSKRNGLSVTDRIKDPLIETYINETTGLVLTKSEMRKNIFGIVRSIESYETVGLSVLEHSHRVGVRAAWVMKHLDRGASEFEQDVAYIAGLLHDFGKSEIIKLEPGLFDESIRFRDLAESEAPMCRAEFKSRMNAHSIFGSLRIGEYIEEVERTETVGNDRLQIFAIAQYVARLHHEYKSTEESDVNPDEIADLRNRIHSLGGKKALKLASTVLVTVIVADIDDAVSTREYAGEDKIEIREDEHQSFTAWMSKHVSFTTDAPELVKQMMDWLHIDKNDTTTGIPALYNRFNVK